MADDDNGDSKWKSAAKAGGKSLSQSGQDMMASAGEQAGEGAREEVERSKDQADRELQRAAVPSMKRGGPVRKTGIYRLHKGERVVPKSRVKKMRSRGRY